MFNNEVLTKIENILGDNNTFIVVKGQLKNIVKKVKEGTGEPYYVADIRIPRISAADDVYSSGFSTINVCFTTEFVVKNKFDDNVMLQFKNNEVLTTLSMYSAVNELTKAENKEKYKVNRVQFYVDAIKLVRAVQQTGYTSKSYNL